MSGICSNCPQDDAAKRESRPVLWGMLGILKILVLLSFLLPLVHPEWSERHDVPFVEKALSTIFIGFLSAVPVFSLTCFLCGAPKPAAAALRFFGVITLLLVILMPMDL
jgi:hypothetical protein